MRRLVAGAFGLIILLTAALCLRVNDTTDQVSDANTRLEREIIPGALAMGDVERKARASMNTLTDLWMDGPEVHRPLLDRQLRDLLDIGASHAAGAHSRGEDARVEAVALAADIEHFAELVVRAANLRQRAELVDDLSRLRSDELRAALTTVADRARRHRALRIRELGDAERIVRAALARQARESLIFGGGLVCISTLLAVGAVALLGRHREQITAASSDLRSALESAKTSALTKSAFLANMSHEIRTPMTAILGYADLLHDESLPTAERRAHVSTIRRNGEHLLGVINDILDISRIEAGRMEIRRSRCSPSQIVAEVVALMRVRSADKGLSLDVEYLFPVPETILSDAMRLRQVLMNLVGNAIKFTDQGGVRIVVRCAPDLDPPRMTFEVVDTGVGMADDQMMRLFQPFTQVDASAARRFGGTGLGLAISRHIAHMLGGDITVHSAPGVGSTFTLAIETGSLADTRMIASAREAMAASGAADNAPASSGDDRVDKSPIRARILLAEDGPDNQRLIAHLLRRAGAEVEIADNGAVAVERVRAGALFDLILMDMQMPEMDGYAATEALRAGGYTGPIVALTAHAMTGDRDRCLKAGCDDYATKPIRRSELIDTVRRHVNAAPSRRRAS